MAEERGEETSAEKVEAWIEQTSQVLLFLVGHLSTPLDFFGFSLDAHLFW